MEVRWLETFAAAAREGSMSAAAQELGYARSTVTHHVQSLERALGTPLFDRSAPGRPLTAAGRALLQHAEVVLDQLAQARIRIAQITSIGRESRTLVATHPRPVPQVSARAG